MGLSRLWLQTGLIQLESVVASNAKRAGDAISLLENSLNVDLPTKALGGVEQTTSSGLILLATPDDVLLKCAQQLAEEADLSACQQLLFCSGSIDSKAVAKAVDYCLPVIGVHPMMSFSSQLITMQEFEGVICAYEGEQASSDLIVDLFRAIGGHMVPIDANAKLQYHLGTVVACNYLNALRMMAEDHLAAAGMEIEDIRVGLSKLMAQTLTNIDSIGAIDALTGPVARGDVGLIERQLGLLEGDELQYRVYKDLAHILLDKLEIDGRATKETVRLRALLG